MFPPVKTNRCDCSRAFFGVDQEAVGNPTDPLGESTEAGARDPRRNGFDAQSRPRARPVSADLLRASTLALSQIARQSTAHLQSFVLPTLATCTQALRDMASQSQVDNQPLTVSSFLDLQACTNFKLYAIAS